VRGLPYNGGSSALEFDSTVITAASGSTTPQRGVYLVYRGMRNLVPTGPTGQPKVTCISRVWIDATSDLTVSGSFVEPCYVAWSSSGAFGECFAVISRYAPFTGTDYGTPHLSLVVYSYNTANAYVYDCGSAAALISDAIGHEFVLTAQIIPATDTEYDKWRRRSQVSPLAGSASTFAGTWTIRNQNLLDSRRILKSTSFSTMPSVNGSGFTFGRAIYSFEQWYGE
jgi:hypothetical protein